MKITPTSLVNEKEKRRGKNFLPQPRIILTRLVEGGKIPLEGGISSYQYFTLHLPGGEGRERAFFHFPKRPYIFLSLFLFGEGKRKKRGAFIIFFRHGGGKADKKKSHHREKKSPSPP